MNVCPPRSNGSSYRYIKNIRQMREYKKKENDDKTFWMKPLQPEFLFLHPRATIMTKTRSSSIISARTHRIILLLLYIPLSLPLPPRLLHPTTSCHTPHYPHLLISRRYNRIRRTSSRYQRTKRRSRRRRFIELKMLFPS
jgi:hypothetical protein